MNRVVRLIQEKSVGWHYLETLNAMLICDNTLTTSSDLISLSGGRHLRETSIAIVSTSIARVRQVSDLLVGTTFVAHRIVWMPSASSFLRDEVRSRFDAVLWDTENREVSANSPSLVRILSADDSMRVITIGATTQEADRAIPHLASFNLTTARLEKALRLAGAVPAVSGEETIQLSAA